MGRIWILPFCLLLNVAVATADESKPPILARVVFKDASSKVGELVSQNDEDVEIRDLVTGKTNGYSKRELAKVYTDISDETAAAKVGLTALICWKVAHRVPTSKPQGAVAKLDGAVIYVSLGSRNGIDRGDSLAVFRGERELKDPITGEVLGKQRRRIAAVQVTEVQEKFCKAKLEGDLEIELKVGDSVEPDTFSSAVAIFAPVDLSGRVSATGSSLVEDLAAALLKRGISVVERRLLVQTLTELGIEQNKLFDEKSIGKIGKQLGAFAVLTGVVDDSSKGTSVNLRLIEVETGRVLCAVSVDRGTKFKASLIGPADLGKPAAADGPNGAKWISKSASYKTSSQYERVAPLPSLLNEDDKCYATKGGVSGSAIIQDGFYAFTTNKEPGAHIVIDLGKQADIAGIYIQNRMETEAAMKRASELTVWLSETKEEEGERIWTADEPRDEWTITLRRPEKARYVRIGFPETKSEYLHLTKVKIFGE